MIGVLMRRSGIVMAVTVASVTNDLMMRAETQEAAEIAKRELAATCRKQRQQEE